MIEVVRMVFPHELVWDDVLGKFRYLGKKDDKIGHPCALGKSSVEWCLQICEYSRSAPYAGGVIMVCAYAKIVGQSVQQSIKQDTVGMHLDDLILELSDGFSWWADQKKDLGIHKFLPTPEEPWGMKIDGAPLWEYGLEKPVLDPRSKRKKK